MFFLLCRFVIGKNELILDFSVNLKFVFFILKVGVKYVEDGGVLIIIVMVFFVVFMGLYIFYVGLKVLVEYFIWGVVKELFDC